MGTPTTTSPLPSPAPGSASLEEVLVTDVLRQRPSRAPDYEAEAHALSQLARALADAPRTLLQRLVEVACENGRADSAGVSLLSKADGGQTFYWPAVTGTLGRYLGSELPRDFSPCGVVLDRDGMQLFSHPERHFAYLAPITPPLEEVLLTPFYVGGRAVGTVWLVSHAPARRFDAEDVRFMRSLGTFAAAAYQAVETMDARAQEREALRSSESRFRRLADTAPVMIWVTEVDGVCSFLSRGWYEFTGQQEAAALGAGWLEAVHPNDRAASSRAFREANAAQAPFALEYRIRRHDGAYRWAIDAGQPRFAEDGTFEGFTGCVIDIHERRLAEEAGARLTLELQEVDRRKDDFLAMLAHELRNPLAPIRTAADLLRKLDAGPDVARVATIVSRQVAHMSRLIDDLLDVSRISRGTIGVQLKPLDLRMVVREVADTAQPEFDAVGVHLLVSVPDAPVVVEADRARVGQVVGNLLNNAAKFTDRGGHVRLSLASRAPHAILSVSDEGIGIAPGHLERIFERFAQVDSSVARRKAGLGLGLALVKTLAELHGGTVTAASEGPGRGSTFTVSLPLATDEGVADIDPTPHASEPVGAPCRVLVVDDNVDSAQMLGELLRLGGHDVDLAHDGPDALRRVEAAHPDIVLLDIGLPGMTGYDVARQIRAASAAPPLLVALTGWGQPADRERSREAGFDVHLLKPVDSAEIARLLADHRCPAPRDARPSGR